MIKEYEQELNELKENKLVSKEDLHEGDEIIYNGEHYFVTLTDTGTDFVWITDDESERYNRNAQGWTLKADWIDEVIGQPEEDELKESLTKSDRDIILDVVKGKYETSHGYLEDKGDYEEALGRRLTDAKYEQLEEFYDDLMDLGPEGFYEEYKDILDFDPDFIAEYGYSEDDEEEDELEESLKEDLSTRKERYKKFDRILALRAADTDEQEEAIKAIYSTLDSLGIKAHYGTSTDQPKIVIFDVGKHYNAIYIHDDGTVLIGGKEEGKVDPSNKEEVKQMLIDYGFIGNGINESWKDFAFIVKCNDSPKELVRVVADNKSKAEKYAKDMYAANHTTYADDRYNVWSIEDKNRSLKEDKVTGKPEDADEKIQFGDEIVYNGKHLFVINANFMDSDRYLWVTDKREDRYNRWAPGKLLAKDLVDKVIRQPDEDGQEDKMNKSIDFTNAADVRHRLDSYSGQYLTITFRGSYDWKYISDLLDEYNDGDEEEADLALDKLEAIYGSEYKLLKALEVDEISEITVYDSDVSVTIKVDKDDLYHNYADLINNPSIKKDTVKILELELNESLKKRYKKFPLKESTSKEKENKEKTIKEDLDFADEAEIRKQLAKYSGQYLTITFKGSEDWKHISDLLDDSINSDDEEEEELALDKLASTYRREYDLLESLEVEEISEIADYTSYVIVTIKVEKDNLLHNFSDNYSDLINMPSIDTDTIKILELDKPTIQDTNTSSMTRDEMVDFIADYVWDLSDTEYRKFKDKIALNFGIIWDNLKEDPEEGVYLTFTDNGLRTIIDKIIKAAKPIAESAH